ncbi:hypothetical protein GWK47_022428 [Chionoecetes opilio]|uniref:Uncharacterized protein n=1 Tax=Chionoecetes opilio TaxID=41210 RepID=A0A8J5CDR3_CHIOP|nr:hypothetical protein GWK47_022428 [Chionoecetes opilio]
MVIRPLPGYTTWGSGALGSLRLMAPLPWQLSPLGTVHHDHGGSVPRGEAATRGQPGAQRGRKDNRDIRTPEGMSRTPGGRLVTSDATCICCWRAHDVITWPGAWRGDSQGAGPPALDRRGGMALTLDTVRIWHGKSGTGGSRGTGVKVGTRGQGELHPRSPTLQYTNIVGGWGGVAGGRRVTG